MVKSLPVGIAQQVSIGLVNCRLAEDHRQIIRLNHDIDLARTIQTELFPTDLPPPRPAG